MTMKLGIKWRRSPDEGEPAGHELAQNRPNGMTPSFASSWLTRDWAKVTVMTLPRALRATKAEMTRCAVGPKTFLTKNEATVTPEAAISFGVATEK